MKVGRIEQLTHTPGPWTLGPCSHGGFLLQRGTPEDGRFVHPQHSLQIVPEADARLIAAAPDMLAALHSVESFIRNGVEFGFIRMPDPDLPDTAKDVPGIVRAAIAKAEGIS